MCGAITAVQAKLASGVLMLTQTASDEQRQQPNGIVAGLEARVPVVESGIRDGADRLHMLEGSNFGSGSRHSPSTSLCMRR